MAIRYVKRKHSRQSVQSPVTSRKRIGQPRTTRLTVNLSTDLVDRLRDTVFGIPQVTLSGLVAKAIDMALCQLESDYGERFPRRTRQLKAGRPRKSYREHSLTDTGADSLTPVVSIRIGHRNEAIPSGDSSQVPTVGNAMVRAHLDQSSMDHH